MHKLIPVGLVVVAACAHGSARTPDAPPEGLVSWANEFPLAAQELCGWVNHRPQDALRLRQVVQDEPTQIANALDLAATHPSTALPGSMGSADSGAWRSHVALPGDPVVETLLAWASRHPDAAHKLEPRALEWIASHHGC
jgi:hypothetical protein